MLAHPFMLLLSLVLQIRRKIERHKSDIVERINGKEEQNTDVNVVEDYEVSA